MDSERQDVVQFSHFRKTVKGMGICKLVKFDLIRRKAQGRMLNAGALEDAHVAALPLPYAIPSGHDQSLFMASTRRNIATLRIVEQMCRFISPQCGTGPTDVRLKDNGKLLGSSSTEFGKRESRIAFEWGT